MNVWSRLACDVTHYNDKCYFSLIDCGPSRFAVWRRVKSEDADSICAELLQVFRERGPPVELLCDNGAVFRSLKFRQLCECWSVRLMFRCAYRPAGNGIVERNHRTIKRMAARTNGDPLDMVFWYNASPKVKMRPESVPALMLSSYQWRCPGGEPEPSPEIRNGSLTVGDLVYVKPPDVRCTSTWPVGKVSHVNSSTNVDINGVPRHVADIRPVVRPVVVDDNAEEAQDVEEEPEQDLPLAMRRPVRTRNAPERFMFDN